MIDPNDSAQREALRDWLALQRALHLEPQTAATLLSRDPDPSRALAAAGRARPADPVLDRECDALARLGVRVVPFGSDLYPQTLAALPDAAPVLLVRGEVGALLGRAAAVVGARAPTAYGLDVARSLGALLAEAGVVAVSGLARGIDAAVHRAALEAGGLTVAWLACGPDEMYPPEHRDLADEIARAGAVVTEMPLATPPLPQYFPLRNRLIAGQSELTVVVEARARSGSLSTARRALEQGREVMAVPGPIDAPTSRGPNRLLRDGATPVCEPADLLQALGLPRVPRARPQSAAGSASAREVLACLRRAPATRDALASRVGLSPGALALALVELELAGRVRTDRDGRLRVVGASWRASVRRAAGAACYGVAPPEPRCVRVVTAPTIAPGRSAPAPHTDPPRSAAADRGARTEMTEPTLTVVGGGLAGCEAAWQAARRGVRVVLFEMKPERMSPAHGSTDLAELVCSNSLRANTLANAVGLLKEEMRAAGSLVLRAADATAVPAGRALAVDRVAFSRFITEEIERHPRIEVRHRLVDRIPDEGVTILATGPLTAPELAADLQRLLGEEYLYFYDAIAPTVYADSIDPELAFRASRWEDGEGEGDYLNLPLDREAYRAFVEKLLAADTVPLHPFEKAIYFEGCLPIEEIARRGPETLAHGPMKPVGLVDPRTGKRPWAVVQLRQEDKEGVLYNLVGFQTKLRVGAQKEVFRSLPGLAKAVFARFGSVHRNTYINAPERLRPTLELVARPGLYVAGQMAGVEGYVESAALGGLAGIGAARGLRGEEHVPPPPESAHGALVGHLMNANAKSFQPMNVNYGLFPPLAADEATLVLENGRRKKLPKREKNERLARRALAAWEGFVARVAPDARERSA